MLIRKFVAIKTPKTVWFLLKPPRLAIFDDTSIFLLKYTRFDTWFWSNFQCLWSHLKVVKRINKLILLILVSRCDVCWFLWSSVKKKVRNDFKKQLKTIPELCVKMLCISLKMYNLGGFFLVAFSFYKQFTHRSNNYSTIILF